MFPAVPYSRYIIGRLPWYSVLIITGILLALLLCSREEKRLGLKPDTVIDLAFWVIPFGIIGARLYYVAFTWENFSLDPLSILRIWEGGLAIYGGIIGGGLGAILFSIRRRISPLMLADMVVPGLALAQCVGRWGNYFNMEAYGAEIINPAWQFFPIGVLIPEHGVYIWHMATFFYESVWDFVIFAVLWFVIRKHSTRHGTVSLWYMLLYGVGRFIIEGFRTDSLMSGSVRISQMLSLALVLSASSVLLFRLFGRKKIQKEGR